MPLALRIRRRLWVALAAVAASLPGLAGASETPRCEAMPAGCTACDCCEKTSPTAEGLDSSPAAVVAPIPATRGLKVVRPAAGPCVCRVPEPTGPAQKPGAREEERRAERGRAVATNPSIHPGPRVPAAVAFMPDVGPPRSPVYLRTMRLLI